MTFEAVLDQAIEMLRRRGRVTYRALQRQFGLDESCLSDLQAEIIEAQRLAVDENGTVLVWTGSADPAPTPISAQRIGKTNGLLAPPPRERPGARRRAAQSGLDRPRRMG